MAVQLAELNKGIIKKETLSGTTSASGTLNIPPIQAKPSNIISIQCRTNSSYIFGYGFAGNGNVWVKICDYAGNPSVNTNITIDVYFM